MNDKKPKKRITFSIFRIIISVLVAYLLYVLATAWLPFFFLGKTGDQYYETHPVSRFYSDNQGNDRIALLEDPVQAGRLRLQLINEAQETINISYHTLIPGDYADMFFAALFEAADRGVKVRFICDAVVGGMNRRLSDVRKAMEAHPNIELGLYEPLNLLMPWTWNNRLHDKYLVVDGKLAIMGGRNIGDKLYQPASFTKQKVFDRDVLIYRQSEEAPSVIDAILDYSQLLWQQPFTKKYDGTSRDRSKLTNAIIEKGKEQRKLNPEYYSPSITDWQSYTLPTNKITLVHNPMGRWSKAPWVWDEMMALFDTAQQRIVMQSPYIVPLSHELHQLESLALKDLDIAYMTNSSASTPNIPGFASFLREKGKLLETGRIYEYMGPGSVHYKSAIMDDRISIIGSFNMDPRSIYLDTETMLVIDSEPFNEHFSAITQYWMDASACYEPDGQILAPENPDIPFRRANILKSLILNIAKIILWPIAILV